MRLELPYIVSISLGHNLNIKTHYGGFSSGATRFVVHPVNFIDYLNPAAHPILESMCRLFPLYIDHYSHDSSKATQAGFYALLDLAEQKNRLSPSLCELD